MKKRILLITQWFDPEPTFKGAVFAKELQRRGFEVEVITGFPNYPGGKIYNGYRLRAFEREVTDGVTVNRVFLFPSHGKSKIGRVANYISFAISSLVFGLIFAKRPSVIYAYHPPLTVGIVAALIKKVRSVPVILDIQDMWPDTLSATGMINNAGILDAISVVCDFVYSSSTKIVVLSGGFKKLLIGRGVPGEKISVIYNWADEQALWNNENSLSTEFANIKGFKVLFAGNIGQAQELSVVLEAARLFGDHDLKPQFLLMGNGLQLADLKTRSEQLNLDNVHFFPPVDMKQVGAYLRSSDALLIHLKADPLFKITIPGKTQAYMAVGMPVIMGVDGDAADIIREAHCGVIFKSEDPSSLATAVNELMSLDRDDLARMGKNAAVFYKDNLSLRSGVDSFEQLFSETIELASTLQKSE